MHKPNLTIISACIMALIGASGAAAGSLRLTTLNVDSQLRAHVPYWATMPYTHKGTITITKACFRWSGEGPYCFGFDHNQAAKTVSVSLKTRNPNTYTLEGFVEYETDGKRVQSNKVRKKITVK